MSGTRSVESLRPRFARDGIFNIRDLGGIALADGASVAPGRVIRADALQRAGATESLLHELGVARVFTPGATMAEIVDWVRQNVRRSPDFS